MTVDEHKKGIFIHINKCGGMSIKHAIKDVPRITWCTMRKSLGQGEVSRSQISDEEWRESFKFCFVRNPYDRIVSAWAMFRDKQSASGNFYKEAITFREFVDIVMDMDVVANNVEYSTDVKFLRSRDNIAHHCSSFFNKKYFLNEMDFIGKFENIQEDFDHVYDVLKIKKGKNWEKKYFQPFTILGILQRRHKKVSVSEI